MTAKSFRTFVSSGCLLVCLVLAAAGTAADGPPIRQLRESADLSHATLRIHAGQRSAHPISPYLTGKFAEHLHDNIINGMDAQILRNPTFADYPLSTGDEDPNGIMKFLTIESEIGRRLRELATDYGWPVEELDGMLAARADGLASFWTRAGKRVEVEVSPDTGPCGGRAQRVQVANAGQGIAQWTYLPLHRTRKYEIEMLARSPDLKALNVSLSAPTGKGSCPSVSLTGLSREWKTLTGSLEVPAEFPAESAYKLALTAGGPGQFVVRHLLLRPADHIHGADPDVIRLLKASHLPLLRWPGGNFASSYHWEDGIGPFEQRPTRPNYAWGGAEPNLFGTDEFIAFCRAVGCEPMICVNAGSGTPAEAARWIEYCNGPVSSPMGARRAANGHPQPYQVKYWEVGNELWGRWQFNWTTAAGYVDRYKEFSQAMLKADPKIKLQACGAPVFWGKQWNDTLIAGVGTALRTITDHPLIGGAVSSASDPLDVYRDFMVLPEVLEQKWSALRQDMLRAGIQEPRLAITELQMFAGIEHAHETNAAVRLTEQNLVRPPTLAEGLYDVLVYHAAVRLAPFVEIITHSATVNHGGGLRKTHERVYANPCYYARAAFADFAGATPVVIEIEAAMERAPRVLPELREATASATCGCVDALAALATDGSLLVSIVHRGSSGPLRLALVLDGFKSSDCAEVHTLAAAVPWAANTLENPDAVKPVDTQLTIKAGKFELNLQPYSVVRLRIPRGD
jgi:alpha-N-arabinofuranosidase